MPCYNYNWKCIKGIYPEDGMPLVAFDAFNHGGGSVTALD